MKKWIFLFALAVGYILGARAGRARYEQIRQTSKKLWETEVVQSASGWAADRVRGTLPRVVKGFFVVLGRGFAFVFGAWKQAGKSPEVKELKVAEERVSDEAVKSL